MPQPPEEPHKPAAEISHACECGSSGLLARLERQPQSDFELEFFGRLLLRNPNDLDVLKRQGELLSRKGLYELAQQIDAHLARLCPDDCFVHYNHACSLALGGRKREALEALERALAHGYDDFDYLELDGDLDSLRCDPRFRRLLLRYRAAASHGECRCVQHPPDSASPSAEETNE